MALAFGLGGRDAQTQLASIEDLAVVGLADLNSMDLDIPALDIVLTNIADLAARTQPQLEPNLPAAHAEPSALVGGVADWLVLDGAGSP